jgi:hypothetical protein
LWRQSRSANGDITPTTHKMASRRDTKWCVCPISGSLLSGSCGTASRSLAAAP